MKTWDPRFDLYLLSRNLQPSRYIEINFVNNFEGNRDGADFIIHDPELESMIIEESYLYESKILTMESRSTWTGIIYIRRILRADRLIIEYNFAVIIAWIHKSIRKKMLHPLFYDIAIILMNYITIIV